MAGIGVPLKLLNEAHGLIVSIELETGQTYRGKLTGIEDNMNVQLRDVTITHRDGHTTFAESCFIRGSHVRFFALPDNLRHAPMFKNFTRKDKSRGMGMGVARAEVARVQASKKLKLPLNCFSNFSAWWQGFSGTSTSLKLCFVYKLSIKIIIIIIIIIIIDYWSMVVTPVLRSLF